MTLPIGKYITGNSVEVMRKWPDKCVDMIFTSVPFKDEEMIGSGSYWADYDAFFKQAKRVTTGIIAIIQSATKLNETVQLYPPDRTIIWGKVWVQMSYRYNPIFIYNMTDDAKMLHKKIWCDCFGILPLHKIQKHHTYQDPVKLYQVLMKMFPDFKLIVDPFAGSGTTAIAAIELNRGWILIDIDPKNKKLFKKRLNGAQTGLAV